MRLFLDDETLTDNMDDWLAGKVIQILVDVDRFFPEELDHQIRVVKLLNRLSSDIQNQSLIARVIARMEDRYGQTKK